MNLKLVYFTLFVLFFFSSCKYEDGPAISLRTKKNRLTNGDWQLQEVTIDNQPYTVEDSNKFDCIIEQCLFTDNRYYVYQKRLLQGGATTLIEFRGNWNFIDSKNKIEVSYTDSDGNIQMIQKEILRLTNSEFWFKASINNCSTIHYMHRE